MKGRTNMKARLGIATAVVVGGGAIGVAAVATGSHSGTTNAQPAGFSINFRHTMSEGAALSAALSQWGRSHQQAMTTLAQMQPMRGFAQTAWHHRTTFAAQRGVAVLATKQFLLVQSVNNPNGALHLWWLQGTTAFANVSSNGIGMAAMTGNTNAAKAAMQHNNMAPAMTAIAGSTGAAQQMAAPVTTTKTITVQTGNTTITITITRTTARVVTPPTTPPATSTAMATPSTTPTAMATPTASATTQPVFTNVNGVVKGDLVFVVGERVRGQLIAKLVLFSAPATTVTPTPSATVSTTTTPTTTPTVTTTPTTAPAVAPSGVSGTHS